MRRDIDQEQRTILRALFEAMPQLGWTVQPDGLIGGDQRHVKRRRWDVLKFSLPRRRP